MLVIGCMLASQSVCKEVDPATFTKNREVAENIKLMAGGDKTAKQSVVNWLATKGVVVQDKIVAGILDSLGEMLSYRELMRTIRIASHGAPAKFRRHFMEQTAASVVHSVEKLQAGEQKRDEYRPTTD